MIYQLIILEKRTGRAWDAAPQVQQVTYTTNRTGSPGTLKFTINASGGISFVEGDPVRFSVDGQLIFLGWVFTKTRDRHAVIDVICYDQLRYLKASASYCFIGRTAGQIVQEIAQDFQLTCGNLEDTGYPIPTLIKEEKSCLDIILAALQETLLATGKLYTFFDDGGALSLREAGSMVAEGVVGEGSLLTNYQYKTDIDQQTYNSIKLARPNEETGRAYSTADLAVGTVTSTDPLKVKVREDMDALPEAVLWLTGPVIEKKIPVLRHLHTTKGFRHNHALPDLSHDHVLSDLSHSHSGAEGETGTALKGSYMAEAALAGSFQAEDGLEQDAFDSDERLLENEIICYEDGQPLPVKDGYIILNRGLEEGDRVLMLRVCRGQQFIILSRIFKGGAKSAARIGH